MRVAQRMISRNYLKSLNTSLSKRAECFERGTSGLKFSKLSENVADGARAMRVQEERQKNETQLDNVKDIHLEMESANTNLSAIDSILQTVQEKTLQAMNDSYGETKRSVLAQEIEKAKEEILQFANAQYGGKYLFSGTNNVSAPFTADEDTGKLLFNGIAVETITREDGKYYYTDDDGNKKLVPQSEDIYMDIGLGIRLSGDDAAPDPRTAFQTSVSGLEVLGFGPSVAGENNGTEVASNAYDLLTQLQNAIYNETDGSMDKEALDDLHPQLVKINDNMRLAQADLNTRVAHLDRIETRLENDIDNLSEMESKLISSEPSEEAINLKQAEYVWMATLQLGARILPSSLLDFIS